MSNELWRLADPNGQQRQVRLDELRASLAGGHIAPNTPVWKPGWKAWQPAHDVPELSTSAVASANGVVPNIPPPPLAVIAVQHALEEKQAASFRPPPIAPGGPKDEQPPPPPAYVPAPSKAPSLSPPPMAAGMPSNLKTAIGLPPPPEIMALAAQRAAERKQQPDPNIEELSGSMLLDESGPQGGMPPPTDPIQSEPVASPFGSPSDEVRLPVRNPLSSLIRDIGEIRSGRPPQNKPKLIAAAAIAVFALLVALWAFISIVSAIFGGSKTDAAASASASGSASASPPRASGSVAANTTAATAPPPPPKEEAKGLGDCATSGEARTLGWRAVIASGIEATPASGGVALGFATSARDGIALALDPSTFAPTTTSKSRAAGGDAKRVVPIFAQGRLVAATDSDRKGDRLQSRRTVGTIPPIDVGVADGTIAWAPHGKDSWAKLFGLDGDAPVEALRAIPLSGDTKGIAVAFRHGNAIAVGIAKGEGVLEKVSLDPIAGLGQVGAPALAASGENLVVAWADRGSASDAWQVRWTKIAIGSSPSAPTSLATPEGGLGVQAMSPSVAGLGGGRFVVAWTEGPVSNHQVRAVTMNADGSASGGALAISPQGLNAGQPSVAVGPDGKGVVAFLAGKGKGYEVFVTPVTCSAR
jgi:hypothetical protein